jgi:hypothetical protein
VQPDESCAEPPVQLPLWAETPPEEAAPLLDVIGRLQADVWASANALRDRHGVSAVRAILLRQASAMDAMLTSYDGSERLVLLPDFSGEDYGHLRTPS